MQFLEMMTRRRESKNHGALVKAYQSVFAGEAGRLVLDDICAVLRQVQWPDGEYSDAADVRAFLDGQKSLALRVLAMLEA